MRFTASRDFLRREERTSRVESSFKIMDKDGDRGGGSFQERLVPRRPTGQRERTHGPPTACWPAMRSNSKEL